MRRSAALIPVLALVLVSTALSAKKKPQAKVTAVPQMAADQKILHALNRLTYGPRASDVEQVRQSGLETWIDQQLHPEDIAENPVLEARLAPLDSLRMTQQELVAHYPTPQVVKAIMDGRQPYPVDPTVRLFVQRLITRYERKQKADAGDKPAAEIDPAERKALRAGTPQDRVNLIASMPEQEQWEVLDALPNGMRQKLFVAAPPELRRRIQMFNGPVQIVNQDLVEGKLLRAVYSNRQLDEVLTDFWFNHFNVDLDKGADRIMVTSYERDVIRPHVLGKFKDLLIATAKSPAMLFYLDNWQSVGPDMHPRPDQKRRQGLNENYGRELMELHTLGVDGGYTQQDVTEVARCFTGWTIRQPQQGGGFDFIERQHDKGEKHVLGITIAAGGGMDDGMKVLDILAQQPATAQFISKSLAVRFVSDTPPESLINKMAATFTATDGDLREVMRTMLDAPEFWAPANFRSKVKSPLEMVASAIRAVNGDIDFATAMTGLMTQLGEPLYRKLEPTGYSNRGADWMNTASLLARMNFANSLSQGRVNGLKIDTAQFTGDPLQIEKKILLTDPSPDAQAAIQAGLSEQQQQQPPKEFGPLVAGLTLGSPDFQKR